MILLSVLGFPAFIVALFISAVGREAGMPLPPMYLTGIALLGVLLAAGAAISVKRARLAGRLRSRNWMLCERCLYDLHATASPGVCPECGTEFSVHDLARKWRRVHDQPDFGKAALVSVEPLLVDPGDLELLRRSSPAIPRAGLREPFGVWPEALVAVPAARSAAAARLGRPARLTRAILFDKAPGRNWSLDVHQDVTVALANKIEAAKGFGPWSEKDGVRHAEAPSSLLRQMATVRLHLDDADEENGCLLVVPMDSEWRPTKLEQKELQKLAKQARPVVVRAGDAVVMSPLTPHASGRNTTDRHRRVLHMEFAAEQPGQGLRWREEGEILGEEPGPTRP